MNGSQSDKLSVRSFTEPAPTESSRMLAPQRGIFLKKDESLTPAFIWRAVQQWWKLALPIGIALAVAGGAVVWMTFKPTYQGTAWLLIKEQPDYLAFKTDNNNSRFAQNQVELIRSPVVLEKVLAKPEIAQLPELLRQSAPLEWLKKSVVTKNEGGSEIFGISFSGSDPTSVAAILNSIVDSYLEVSAQKAADQTSRVIQLLTEELERRGKEVERLRNNVRVMTKEISGTDPFAANPGRTAVVLHTTADTLQERLESTQVERQVLEARLKALDEALAATPEEFSAAAVEQFVENRPEIIKLKQDIEDERTHQQEEERVAQPNYLQGSTRMKTLLESDVQRLEELKTRFKSAANKELVASERKKLEDKRDELLQQLTSTKLTEQLFQARVDKLAVGQTQTGDRSLELEFAKHELDRAEGTYQRIAERILALNTEMRAPERVTLLRRAAVPTAPEVASPTKLLGMVSLCALGLPFGLAIGWERRVRRIVEPQQIEEGAQLPVVAEIAELPDGSRARGLLTRSLSKDRHLFEESVDSLRTTLALSEQLKEVHVIAVVSAVSREGKTSLSSQLALSLARSTGEPVLLIDADLRSPDLHDVFAVPAEPGLAKVLAHECTLQEATQRTDTNPLVQLLPAGKLQKNPHSLMRHRNIKSVLEEARSQYRYVLIDTAPILSASESLVVAKSADGVLMCALRESSRTGQLRQTYERLSHVGARVIGVVLSGIPAKSYSHRYGSYVYSQAAS